MFRKEKTFINDLQKNTKNIRNLCILAHVDHGKTTLADTLLATNAIISNRMSGKLRYMDTRQDEQQRGITMKSSAISLIHKHTLTNDNYLINLIDSPGHVDFSTEVSTAVRLCDGATILIDVCEGICPQTHAVLRQAWLENLKLILVFNKIDRLILELKMSPLEAYNHMVNILGQFNAIVAQQFTSLLMEKNSRLTQQEIDENVIELEEDIDESKLYFSPKYNNVFFASSIDGWGFGINHFADIYSAKLGFKRDTLLNTLWGDFYLNSKTKRIMKNAQANAKKPLFVQLVLENLWQVYDAVFTRRDSIMTEKILTSLNIKMNARDLKYTDPKGPLQALFLSWLPIGRNLLDMIVDMLPSPLDMTNEKVEHLICSKMKPFNSLPKETRDLKTDFMSCGQENTVIVFISKMFATEKENIVKKHLSLEDLEQRRELIRQRKLKELAEKDLNVDSTGETEKPKITELVAESETENKYEFLAFARVFSGTLRKGKDVFILLPKHNPEDFVNKNIDINSELDQIQLVSKHVYKQPIKELYLMMGRELESVDEVPCGNIVAIGGLEHHCIKSATLSSTPFCPAFTDMFLQTTPILRVAVEPKHPARLKDLERGLKLLNQADPCVEILVQENGENILCTAGEVHLQRCVEDLVNLFAKCEINISQPIIPFKETIVKPLKSTETSFSTKPDHPTPTTSNNSSLNTSGVNQTGMIANSPTPPVIGNSNVIVVGPDGRIDLISPDKRVRISVRAKPLPLEVTHFLEESASLIKLLTKYTQTKTPLTSSASFAETVKILKKFKVDLEAKLKEASENDEFYSTKEWKTAIDRIISFGPNRFGPNVLVNLEDELKITNVWSVLEATSAETTKTNEYENNIIFGFNLATAKGPLCEEPMQGVAFFMDYFQVTTVEDTTADLESNMANLAIDSAGAEGVVTEKKITSKSVSVNFISLMKDTCRRAFEAQPQRLMAAMYKCEVMTVSSEALGKLYAVLGKRNAKILEETIKENTNMFLIIACIPIADSFGLAEEVRKRTSGLASLHIEYSHYETIDIDPYWEPKTEEELLHYGDKADFENQARKYMNDVRKRKGMFVKEKLVEHSEKQRNLTIK